MGRIRTIKPEFPQSESIGVLSRDARLLFILLWTIADDSGRARAASRMLASLLYPYDDDAAKKMEGWLTELEEHGHIRRYEVDGSKYLDIPKWLKHQKIDKPSPSKLPPFDEVSGKPREASANVREASATDLDLGSRKGKDQDIVRFAHSCASRTDVGSRFDKFWEAYPKRDGRNPKEPARKKFTAAIKSGVDAEQIIAGAKRYAGSLQAKQQIGTPYVAMAVTWLNQRSWDDEPAASATPVDPEVAAHHAKIAIMREIHQQRGTWPSQAEVEHEYQQRNGRTQH